MIINKTVFKSNENQTNIFQDVFDFKYKFLNSIEDTGDFSCILSENDIEYFIQGSYIITNSGKLSIKLNKNSLKIKVENFIKVQKLTSDLSDLIVQKINEYVLKFKDEK